MCLNPISLRLVTGTDAALIPCGKCAECLKRKANELTVRVIREVEALGNFTMVTLTYDNKSIPIGVTSYDCDTDTGEIFALKPVVFSKKSKNGDFYRKKFFEEAPYKMVLNKDGKPSKRYAPLFTEVDGETVCLYYSIHTKDMQNWLKSSRMAYERKYGKKLPEFKYLAVPEYGGVTYRPHYHVLFCGLSDEQIQFLALRWKDRYGHARIDKIKTLRNDYSKVAHYVSKYANKGSFDCPYIEKYCDKPRKCFSIGFGIGDREDLLRRVDYWLCRDVYGDYSSTPVSSVDDEKKERMADLILSRKYYDMNGYKYPIPDYIKKKIFYTYEYDYRTQKVRRVASELQKLVTFTLFKHLRRDVDRECRQIEQSAQNFSAGVQAFFRSYDLSQEAKKEVITKDFVNSILQSIY